MDMSRLLVTLTAAAALLACSVAPSFADHDGGGHGGGGGHGSAGGWHGGGGNPSGAGWHRAGAGWHNAGAGWHGSGGNWNGGNWHGGGGSWHHGGHGGGWGVGPAIGLGVGLGLLGRSTSTITRFAISASHEWNITSCTCRTRQARTMRAAPIERSARSHAMGEDRSSPLQIGLDLVWNNPN